MQENRPITLFSKALNGNNRALSTYDDELLALVLPVERWKGYLMDQQFIVRNRSLQPETSLGTNNLHSSRDG